jgi:replicative DNA helicase
MAMSTDIDLTTNPNARFQEYLDIKTRPNGLIGMATGFTLIDKATAGLQPGQLVVIIAPPKTGKSVIALQTAVNLHNDGFVPMFQSFEMSNQEQKTRHDAMRANISYARLTRGDLKVDEEARYKKMLQRMETMHKFYLTDSISARTVSGLSAKIEKLQPDIVFIDGVYLMTDEISGEQNSALALTNITRSLKRLAQKIKKPVVITTQVLEWKMKKNRVSASSIGYSSSFFQDADVILALERQDEFDDSSRLFRIEASRNSGKVEVELLWDWENGKFQEYSSS